MKGLLALLLRVDSTGNAENLASFTGFFFYFLLLMLVVISLTFSAKAGSERIRLSTFSSECMMVE